jgi:hypothetical protein
MQIQNHRSIRLPAAGARAHAISRISSARTSAAADYRRDGSGRRIIERPIMLQVALEFEIDARDRDCGGGLGAVERRRGRVRDGGVVVVRGVVVELDYFLGVGLRDLR